MAVRVNFHEELDAAERVLLTQGSLVRAQLEDVVAALRARDVDLAGAVIERDDAVDALYVDCGNRILNLLALQAPVAGDLRLVSALLHSNVHVERMGDLCVNVAKFVRNRHPYPPASPMLARLEEMGARAAAMLDTAMAAFAQRSVDLAERLPVEDDVLDRLNRGMLGDLKQYAGDERTFEWATNLVLVARYLERFGDHAVDVGEQIAFLVTGVFREFTDASHPEGEPA
ncbi:MAG TPA: phosphate signaling complex protein PhoU [Actinomycetota bacterium]|nr:phosphate signaling complex protein PhoU [Actinomycetota bacterium]